VTASVAVRWSVLVVAVPSVLAHGYMVLFTSVTEATSCAAADVLGHALELVVTLLTAGQGSTLVLEVAHAHGGQSGGLVVGGTVVVNLVDGDGGVDYIGLDSLLLDDRLDSLMDVVVDMLASDRGCDTLALRGALNAPLVLELGLLSNKVSLDSIVVTVVELAVLNSTEVGSVLFWENLAILDWLNSAVVVILVDLLVYSCVDLLVLVRLDSLLGDSGGNGLVDGSVMVSRALGEVTEGRFNLVHFERCG